MERRSEDDDGEHRAHLFAPTVRRFSPSSQSCNHAIKIVFVIANLTVMHPGLRPPSHMLQLPSLDHFLLVPEINPKLTYSM